MNQPILVLLNFSNASNIYLSQVHWPTAHPGVEFSDKYLESIIDKIVVEEQERQWLKTKVLPAALDPEKHKGDLIEQLK